MVSETFKVVKIFSDISNNEVEFHVIHSLVVIWEFESSRVFLKVILQSRELNKEFISDIISEIRVQENRNLFCRLKLSLYYILITLIFCLLYETFYYKQL